MAYSEWQELAPIEAYWNTPEFKAYEVGFDKACELDVARFGGKDRWTNKAIPELEKEFQTQCAKNVELLNSCRALPIHKQVFGW